MSGRWAARLLQGLRRAGKRWSKESDQAFHDELFAAQRFDPFTFAYPGYITISRIADLLAPHAAGCRTVADVGCGPGEITCELARRHPGIAFTGVDHSAAAVTRARENARRLGLDNVTFLQGDAEHWAPAAPLDLVVMCDSFHHLQRPREFITRMERHCRRFTLVEPQGDRWGRWRNRTECDWLVLELDKIRRRLVQWLGEEEIPAPPSPAPTASAVQAVENRYAWDDFRRFFAGYGLKIRGTVCGIEHYPPGAGALSPSRERFGRLAYEMYREVDETLHERGLDLAARHWVIYAEQGAVFPPPVVPDPPRPPAGADAVCGPYEAVYSEFQGEPVARCAATIWVDLTVHNHGFLPWDSTGPQPVFLSYHWLDRSGAALVYDGVRTPLPRPLAPGESCRVTLRVEVPPAPGRRVLAVDMVHEGVTWFSQAGASMLRVPYTLRAAR